MKTYFPLIYKKKENKRSKRKFSRYSGKNALILWLWAFNYPEVKLKWIQIVAIMATFTIWIIPRPLSLKYKAEKNAIVPQSFSMKNKYHGLTNMHTNFRTELLQKWNKNYNTNTCYNIQSSIWKLHSLAINLLYNLLDTHSVSKRLVIDHYTHFITIITY